MSSLAPGEYAVKITAKGFADFAKTVQIAPGVPASADAQLAVAGSATQVEVTAQSEVQVEVESSALSQVVDAQRVAELPSLTRDPYDFVQTLGNVQQDTASGTGGRDEIVRGAGVSIGGQRSSGVDILLDGGENVDLYTTQVGQSVPQDAVETFSVTTSNFSSEYGRASGGVLNVVTKSGTNQFHGSLYEFNRLSALTSNDAEDNALGNPKAKYTRNQFGYSFGGPVIKDKLFFFSSTEWTRVRSEANEQAVILDPSFIATANSATRAFFNGQQLRPGLTIVQKGIGSTSDYGNLATDGFSYPNAFDLVSYQVPSDSGGGQPQNLTNTVEKVDYHLSDKTMLTGRYALFDQTEFAGTINNSPYMGYDTGQKEFDNNFMLSVSHVWNPQVISDSKILFNRLNLQQPLASTQPVQPTLYLNTQGAASVNGIDVYLPGYSATTPGNAIPFGGPQNVFELAQAFSWNRGKHELHFGAEYLYTRDNRTFGAYENAIEGLNGTTTPDDLQALQNGQLGWFEVVIDPQGKFPCPLSPTTGVMLTSTACSVNLPASQPSFARSDRYNDFSTYIQDNFKVMRRLTLNLGVRWEYYGVQHNSNPALDSNFVLGSGNNIFEAMRTGQVYTVAATANSPASPVGGLWKPEYHNFAPRFGFAWDVFGDGKTSLRGGYGISYERNFGNVTYNVIQNPPAQFNYAVTGASAGMITTSNLGPFAATSGTLALSPPDFRYVSQNIPTAYTNMWNLSIQHQLRPNTLLSIEYSGAHGVHLYSIENLNQTGFGDVYLGTDPTVNPTDRLNEQYANMNTRGANGFSFYEGLNTSLQATNLLHQGLDLTANWTWSHSIDNLSSTFSETPQALSLGLLDPFNPKLDKGDSDFDARQRIALSAVWTLPYAKDTKGVLNRILDGWVLAPILVAHTGNPFTVFDMTNWNPADTNIARYIPSGPINMATSTSTLLPGAAPNTYQYMLLPPSSPYMGTIGRVDISGEVPDCSTTKNAAGDIISTGQNCVWPANMTHRNAFRGPGWYDINMAIRKNFKVTERMKLQFSTEFYNLLNHSNYYIQGSFAQNASNYPGANVPIIGAFGVNPAPGIPNERRFIQMALRLSF
jgi:hypothetical protein